MTQTESPDRRVDTSLTLQELSNVLELKNDVSGAALDVCAELISLLDRKQSDYGPNNISAFGEFGVLVRVSDKLERLKNLQKNPNPNNESIDDTWSDIANYAIIALLIRRGLWPNCARINDITPAK